MIDIAVADSKSGTKSFYVSSVLKHNSLSAGCLLLCTQSFRNDTVIHSHSGWFVKIVEDIPLNVP